MAGPPASRTYTKGLTLPGRARRSTLPREARRARGPYSVTLLVATLIPTLAQGPLKSRDGTSRLDTLEGSFSTLTSFTVAYRYPTVAVTAKVGVAHQFPPT